jgi:hypothetical protein
VPDEQPTGGQGEPINSEVLELKLKALKSDLRLMIIASVALNQFLVNVSIPAALTVPAITVALLAPAFKGILAAVIGRN